MSLRQDSVNTERERLREDGATIYLRGQDRLGSSTQEKIRTLVVSLHRRQGREAAPDEAAARAR
ncbi:MAG: hypothetical protein OEY86_18670, partial [Nitrospira sp.]|nr:hypothetical protein [Nitrospira sp.]